jgi:uncharacterized protein YraI
MNIQHYLKSVVLAGAIIFSSGAIQISFAYGGNYKVENVASWDVLHVRSGAGMGYDSISQLPATARNIKIISDEKDIGGSSWVKIEWKGQSGWVNRRHLATTTTSPNFKETDIYFNPLSTGKNTDDRGSLINKHTHPANKCVASVTHSHKSHRGHFHKYDNCKKDKPQLASYPSTAIDIYNPEGTIYRPQETSNTHAHPANRCTSSLSHRHAGPVDHSHSYSCEANDVRGEQQLVAQPTDYTVNRFQHTHGKSQCVNAISHFHNGGDKIHRHECPKRSGGRNQSSYNHTHPANSLTRASTHSHPYQDRRHQHQYGY